MKFIPVFVVLLTASISLGKGQLSMKYATCSYHDFTHIEQIEKLNKFIAVREKGQKRVKKRVSPVI